MDKNLFLPLSWEELKWWVNTSKRLVNDISGGRPCGAFDLTPDLCGWIFCEFRHQVELALTAFAQARKAKAHTRWLKVKWRR
jgi:hypothetical protein